MRHKKPALGKGLDVLLGGSVIAVEEEPSNEAQLVHLPVSSIVPGKFQPRSQVNPQALNELTHSVRVQGVLQPIVVRCLKSGQYEIIAGERRWQAAQQAGLAQIPAIVRDLDDETTLAVALIENIQRENLNPLEEATALQRLIEQFSMTHQQVADIIGKSRAMVSNLTRLLGLHDEVKVLLGRGDIEMGHARALLPLNPSEQVALADIIVGQGLSVRDTEQLVRRRQNPDQKAHKTKSQLPEITRWQARLTKALGTDVDIAHSKRGKGRVIIHYNSVDDLEKILEQID